MIPTFKQSFILLLISIPRQICFSDTIVTQAGNTLHGTVVEISNGNIIYTATQSEAAPPDTISRDSVASVSYTDGSELTFSTPENRSTAATSLYSAFVFCETGLFGLINSNEEYFDPGIFTIGVTPGIDRRINDHLSIGAEYMILWATPTTTKDARFIMNCNAVFRLSFPMNKRISFLTQLNAGFSIWPGAESVLDADSTFFQDRIGWNVHGGIGVAYKTTGNSSLVLYAAYNANFSTRYDIPVTIDMLLISVGPRITF